MKRNLVLFAVLLFLTNVCFAQRAIKIDLTAQRAYLIDHGKIVLDSPICSGRARHETPIGTFRVTDKDLNHASNFYGFLGNPATKQIVVPDADIDMKVPPGLEFVKAPMRYYVQFQPAIGLHAGYLPGHPDSHGCVRLPEQYAIAMFRAVSIGTPVYVYGRPQAGRWYWASPRGRFSARPAAFGWHGHRHNDQAAFDPARDHAFDQFEQEWDANEKALDHQIDVLEEKKEDADGSRKAELQLEVKRLERLKDELDVRRDAAKEMLKRKWGDN